MRHLFSLVSRLLAGLNKSYHIPVTQAFKIGIPVKLVAGILLYDARAG